MSTQARCTEGVEDGREGGSLSHRPSSAGAVSGHRSGSRRGQRLLWCGLLWKSLQGKPQTRAGLGAGSLNRPSQSHT